MHKSKEKTAGTARSTGAVPASWAPHAPSGSVEASSAALIRLKQHEIGRRHLSIGDCNDTFNEVTTRHGFTGLPFGDHSFCGSNKRPKGIEGHPAPLTILR